MRSSFARLMAELDATPAAVAPHTRSFLQQNRLGLSPRCTVPDPVFHFSTPIKIRFRDLDAFGHVNNAVYFTYMEVARTDYFTHVGLLKTDEFPRRSSSSSPKRPASSKRRSRWIPRW